MDIPPEKLRFDDFVTLKCSCGRTERVAMIDMYEGVSMRWVAPPAGWWVRAVGSDRIACKCSDCLRHGKPSPAPEEPPPLAA